MNGVEQHLCDSGLLTVDKVRLEHTFRRFETFTAHADHTTVRERIVFNKDSSFLGKLVVKLKVVTDIAELLLHLAHSLKISCAVEGITAAKQQTNKLAGDVTTCNVKSCCKMVENDTLVDRDNMGYTIPRIDNNTRAKT